MKRDVRAKPELSNSDPHRHKEDYDTVILGAGISGLVSASVLQAAGERRILIADEYESVGGNHIDFAIGDYTFDVGSFIFQDDSPLLRHFPDLLPRYVAINPGWSRLNPQGKVTHYPISLRQDVLGKGFLGVLRILASVGFARLFHRRQENARDFARFWIGDRLLRESGLESYMARFYGVAPEEIDIELARKRMLWISEHASIRGLARRFLTPRALHQANTQLVRPQEGFRSLYELAQSRLEKGGVQFSMGSKIELVALEGDGFHLVVGGRPIGARRLVSTIPLERIGTLCGLEVGPELRTITLVSLFFSFSGERGFVDPILYNFSHDGAWKRLTVHSDFYGRANGREFFSVEVIGKHVGDQADRAEEDFRRHVRANGLFSGDLKLEGSFTLDNAYPIYSRQSAKAASRLIAELAEMGIESFGRQGGFNYQPTARVSTIEAEAALDRKAKD